MENDVQENQMREEPTAGEVPAVKVGVRVDSAELATRPLSQFILSKEYAGVSANPELIRPVTSVAAPCPADERRRETSAPIPARRIEYPFYDDEPESADDGDPLPPPDSGTAVPDSAEPEVLELSPERPVAPPRPSAPIEPAARDISFRPISLPHLLVGFSTVSADEAASPLPGARVRTEEFPLLDYFLNGMPPRR